MTVGINMQANPQQTVQAVQKVTREFQILRREIQAVEGDLNKLAPDIRAEVEEAGRRLNTIINSGQAKVFNRNLRLSGQAGINPLLIDPSKIYPSSSTAGDRVMNQMARMAGIPIGAAAPAPTTGAGGGGAVGAGSMAGDAVKGMITKFLLPALGLGGIAGTLMSAVKSAQEYGPEVDKLLRSLGDVRSSFDTIDTAVRKFGTGLQMNDIQSAHFLQAYERASGGTSAADLYSGGRTAVGFARAYGIDPGQMAGVFGGEQLHGMNPREFALTTAQAIASTGLNGKADEIVAILGHFSQQAADALVNNPALATERYAQLFASLRATAPGMGPGAIAATLGQMDSAFRNGGGYGEASKVFLYRALGEHNPFKFRYDLEGGLFEGGNFDRVMGALKSSTAGMGSYQRYDAMANALGISSRQAQVMDQLHTMPNASAFRDFLKRSGVDLMQASPDSFQNLAQIFAGTDIDGMKQKLLSAATPAQRSMIMNASPEQLPGILAQVASQQGREKNQGTDTLDALASIKDALTESGAPIVSALNTLVNFTAGDVVPTARDWIGKGLDWADGSKYPNEKAAQEKGGRTAGWLGDHGYQTIADAIKHGFLQASDVMVKRNGEYQRLPGAFERPQAAGATKGYRPP